MRTADKYGLTTDKPDVGDEFVFEEAERGERFSSPFPVEGLRRRLAPPQSVCLRSVLTV